MEPDFSDILFRQFFLSLMWNDFFYLSSTFALNRARELLCYTNFELKLHDSQQSAPKYRSSCSLMFCKVYVLKAFVCYLLSNFYFSPNGSPSKTMKNVFYFIQKALLVLEIFKFLWFFVLEIFKFFYFRLPLFFSLSAIALELIQEKS